MQQLGLSERIIKLDKNIRFVGIVSGRGEVIEGGFREGIQPLLDGTEEQQMYVQSLANVTMLQQFSDRLGKVRYSITEHEKVILLTVPVSEGILCVSASSKADAIKIRDKVLNAIKGRPRKMTSRKNNAKG
jgi:hypothetical protein